jgi:hypothetical protein
MQVLRIQTPTAGGRSEVKALASYPKAFEITGGYNAKLVSRRKQRSAAPHESDRRAHSAPIVHKEIRRPANLRPWPHPSIAELYDIACEVQQQAQITANSSWLTKMRQEWEPKGRGNPEELKGENQAV